MHGCGEPTGYLSDRADCNDGNAAINPAAQEVCNGADDDCDGLTDDADPSILVSSQSTYYHDGDGDGYGAGAAIHACVRSAERRVGSGDCNDGKASINTAAQE